MYAILCVSAIILSPILANESKVCEFDLIWHDGNSTQTYVYKARTEITDGLQNAEKIELNTTLDELYALDLAFASELKILLLDNVGLTQIKPGAFQNLPQTIQNFSITNNMIDIITEDVFNNLTVRHLNLTNNKIQSIQTHAFNNMRNLSTIILDHNEIAIYNIQFSGCPSLDFVSIRYNFVEELAEGIFSDVKDNILTIDMSFNKIKKIHKLAYDIKEFKEVFLNHNELEDALVLIKLVKADKVDLSFNKVQCLPKEFMENGLSKIKNLNLTENPLNCSCLHDLRKKVRKNIEFQKMSPLVKNIHITLPEKDCDKKE